MAALVGAAVPGGTGIWIQVVAAFLLFGAANGVGLLLFYLHEAGVPAWVLVASTVLVCFGAIRWNAQRPALSTMAIARYPPPETRPIHRDRVEERRATKIAERQPRQPLKPAS